MKSSRQACRPRCCRERHVHTSLLRFFRSLLILASCLLYSSLLAVQEEPATNPILDREQFTGIRSDPGKSLRLRSLDSAQVKIPAQPITLKGAERRSIEADLGGTNVSLPQTDGPIHTSKDVPVSPTGYFNPLVREFEHQEGVVIATKVHGPSYFVMLQQSLCLLTQAYNNRVAYDIVVFTTEAIDEGLVANLTATVFPAKVRVVQDNDGLQAEIDKLTPMRRENFLRSCRTNTSDNLHWYSECPHRLAYNWQAEFRSLHIWKHPAILPYRWMMWLDADAFCSKRWERDPVAIALQHNMSIFFDNFPQGTSSGAEVDQRIQAAFGESLCSLQVHDEGYLERKTGQGCAHRSGENARIPLIHGFFHITKLDFFRSPDVQAWTKILIGDGFLQRRFDDQLAVTVPAAILAPRQSILMRKLGVELQVYHNFHLDGRTKVKNFRKEWHKKGWKMAFPEGAAHCTVTITD